MNTPSQEQGALLTRREILKAGGLLLLGGVSSIASKAEPATARRQVERWDFIELTLDGPKDGNPFIDIWIRGVFSLGARSITVDGFYDGDGLYKIRFMPDAVGVWSCATQSNHPSLAGKTSSFEVVSPAKGNHGPVRVRDIHHFGYEDGTPYFPFGTTCYAWVHQPETLQDQTLESLRASPFNKIRMCIFPKWYQYNRAEPPRYPFPRTGEVNDYSRFNPDYFRHIETQILRLRSLGIEADLILFHPYDHWGFQEMPTEVDDRYLRYVIARFASFRNVWWSLANEYDLMRKKTPGDWDRFAALVCQSDPYGHLRSIHYSRAPYDYTRVWCTHAGVQDTAFEKASGWRALYNKPLVFDEMQYEGNINSRWGNLAGEDMTRRFWLCVLAGAYGGHGETYVTPDDIENSNAVLWWSHGGKLSGSSPARIAFLRRLVEEAATGGKEPLSFKQIEPVYYLGAKSADDRVLVYHFDNHQPLYYDFPLPEHGTYYADLIDPWEMTLRRVPGSFTGKSRIILPGRPYQAIRFVRG